MRHARFGLILAGIGALGLAAWAPGCLFAPDDCTDLLKCPGTGAVGGSTAGTGTGGAAMSTSTSTGTGTVSCVDDVDCGTALAGSCKQKICSSSVCTDMADPTNKPANDNNPCTSEACTGDGMPYHPAIQAGMPCEGMAGVCNGSGACVQCVINSDCTTGTTPSCDTTTNTCGSCSDNIKNGAETGVDCGGSCKACTGDPCSTGGGCLSGKCVDKVCCATDCNGTCQVCNIQGSLGTCTNAPAEQPDPACNALVCDGAGACKTPAGAPCSLNSGCASGICIASTCRVPTNGACTEDALCASGRCAGSICTACSADNECKSNACAAPTCKAPGGAICSAAAECAGGSCQSSFCILNNGLACTINADCKSGFCSGGTCTPCMNDGNCTGNAKCGSAFGANACSLPTGASCYSDTYCTPGTTCQGTPRKCQ